jgi:hypothetical protein
MVLLASTYDQSRFLNAVDLAGEKKFRIRETTEEEVGQDKDKEKKLVVWFTNDKRGLVLNNPTTAPFWRAFGDDVSGWKDKIVVVFPTTVEFRGKMVPGLRVRIPAPKQATAGSGQRRHRRQSRSRHRHLSTTARNPAQSEAEAPKPKPVDRELDELPVSASDDLDDEIPF